MKDFYNTNKVVQLIYDDFDQREKNEFLQKFWENELLKHEYASAKEVKKQLDSLLISPSDFTTACLKKRVLENSYIENLVN